jgi:hypothetical protein
MWGVGLHLHSFLTSALDGSDLYTSRTDRFPLEKNPATYWIRAGYDS